MGQSVVVMSFRKRLKKYKYSDIRIYKDFKDGRWTGRYEVIANEPLSGTRIEVHMTEGDMLHWCR